MSSVTVSPKYQIVIPKNIREEASIKPGSVLWTGDRHFKDLDGVRYFTREA
jgi:bifunctional DNA-binding transcriptional regulator/antitoxin component of YhaV-PrlF toxin-antitoxin module